MIDQLKSTSQNISPTISIIIPAYNVELYIRACIDSVLDQKYGNFELILIDDGSSDATSDIIKSYSDQRIQLVSNKNLGVSTSRNIGITLAKGEYIYFLDSDDWIESNLLQDVVQCIRQTPADVVLFNFFTDHISDDDTLLLSDKTILPQFQDVFSNIDEKIFPLLGYIWSKMYRLEFIKAVGVTFDPAIHLYEDIIFNTKIFAKTHNVAQLPGHYYHYSSRQKSSLVKSYNSKILDYITAMHEALAILLAQLDVPNPMRGQLFSSNIMMGVKHTINTLFKYSSETDASKLKIVRQIMRFPILKAYIKSFRPLTRTDKIYKVLIANNLALSLFALCKFKK